MKKILIVIVLVVFSAFSMPAFLSAAENPSASGEKLEFVLFHLETCPHCRDEIKFINEELMPKHGEFIDLKMYEVSTPENREIFEQYGYYYKTTAGSVPMTFIEGEIVAGYGNDEITGKQIMEIVERKLLEKGLIENGANNNGEGIVVPALGKINPKNFSLPLLTVIIGLLDGFNPCAMWVLLFLISLLLGIEDRKRMWLLGSVFIFASGLVYFVFMAAWLHFLLFVGMIFAVRIIIGIVGIGIGSKNLWDYWQMRKTDGTVCNVSKDEKTRKIFDKIKEIVHRQSLWWSIAGIVFLGFSVNLVELACSAGFPAVYTQVLAMSGIPAWERYLYMVGYIIFYMLDDMIVFVLAMLTLKSKIIGSRYAKYSNLIGGLLILILGLLLIFKPEWLMFA